MHEGYKRLAVLLAFVGFVVGFIRGASAGGFGAAFLLGVFLGIIGAVGALLLGWTVEGFKTEATRGFPDQE